MCYCLQTNINCTKETVSQRKRHWPSATTRSRLMSAQLLYPLRYTPGICVRNPSLSLHSTIAAVYVVAVRCYRVTDTAARSCLHYAVKWRATLTTGWRCAVTHINMFASRQGYSQTTFSLKWAAGAATKQTPAAPSNERGTASALKTLITRRRRASTYRVE